MLFFFSHFWVDEPSLSPLLNRKATFYEDFDQFSLFQPKMVGEKQQLMLSNSKIIEGNQQKMIKIFTQCGFPFDQTAKAK